LFLINSLSYTKIFRIIHKKIGVFAAQSVIFYDFLGDFSRFLGDFLCFLGTFLRFFTVFGGTFRGFIIKFPRFRYFSRAGFALPHILYSAVTIKNMIINGLFSYL
jgi:hypothetical protein